MIRKGTGWAVEGAVPTYGHRKSQARNAWHLSYPHLLCSLELCLGLNQLRSCVPELQHDLHELCGFGLALSAPRGRASRPSARRHGELFSVRMNLFPI